MTHAEYLEQHHELSNAGLSEIALMQGRGDYDDATTGITNLRAMLDALWELRRAAAEREVAP
jgi:hypothetical protein